MKCHFGSTVLDFLVVRLSFAIGGVNSGKFWHNCMIAVDAS